MAAKGGLGIELDLDKVPAREAGMTPYEFLLSESQERMLFVVKPGTEQALMARFTMPPLAVPTTLVIVSSLMSSLMSYSNC
mgnify:CR=1 FL=1